MTVNTTITTASITTASAPTITILDQIGLIEDVSAQHEAGAALAADLMTRRLPGISEYEWAHRAQDYLHNIIWENFSQKNVVHVLQFCILELRKYTD